MTQVTDGKNVFDEYYFEKGQLHSHGNFGFGRSVNKNGLVIVSLWLDGKYVNRSLQKLKRWSCPDPKLKRLLKRVERNFVPVFGHEDMYKFNPKNPTEVFNIEKRHLKNVLSFKKYYAVAIKEKKDQNLLIHQMVMEYHLQEKIDTKVYDIHHLNHDSRDNRIQNLMLLPRSVHDSFEGHYKYYKNKNPKKVFYSKKDMINFINHYDITAEQKERLQKSL